MLKRIALVAVGLIVIGLGGIVTSAAIHKTSIQNYVTSLVNGNVNMAPASGQNFDKSGSVDGTSVKSIQVTAYAASVHVYPGTTSQITAHAYGYVGGIKPSDLNFSVKKNGNQVTVSLDKSSNPLFHFGVNLHLNMDVEVPKQVYDELNVQAFAGKVSIENLDAKSFVLHSSAGSITASNLTGHVQATSSAGSVTATDIQGDVDLHSSAGSVTARSIQGSVQAHSSAGSVLVQLQDITHNVTVGSSAGSVRITTQSVPSALQFSLHASAGSAHFGLPNAAFTTNKHSDIQGSIGQGGPMLQIESSAGSVEVGQGPVS